MKKNFLLIFGIIFLVVIFERLLSASLIMYDLEFMTYDWRAQLATDKGPFREKFKPADKNIIMVSIDDDSISRIAQDSSLKISSWPWSRTTWAQVVDYIEKGQPKAILFDILFNNLNENTKNDEIFSQTLKKYDNVVLATSLNNSKLFMQSVNDEQERNKQNGAKKTNLVVTKFKPAPYSLNVKIEDKNFNEDYITYYSHSPIYDIYTSYNTMAVVNKTAGKDYIIRKSQPIFKLIKGDKAYYMPSLSFAAFLKHMGEGDVIKIKNSKIIYKNREIPIDSLGQVDVSWHGVGYDYAYDHKSFLPIADILLSLNNNKYISPNYFKDKIVLIGRSQSGTDIHATAVNRLYAGTEYIATVADNFINDTDPNNKMARKILTKLSGNLELFLTFVCCLALALLGLISKNALMCFLNSFFLVVLYIIFCAWSFCEPNVRIWVPMVIPIYYMLATPIIVFTYRFQKEKAKRAAITDAFGKFVSPKVLSTLLKEDEKLVLKSTKKPITVMFCDVKDFTSLSEKYDPKELMDDLNELFEIVVSVIFENNGTVDKFIGDSIMAYWGDPIASEDDALMAVKAALEIKNRVNDLKVQNARENKIILDVKIGINTGEALLGLAGSEKIMSYTAMGDAVNVAARLESSCSKLKKDILISQATYEDVKNKIIAEDVDTISVKGREEKISVFEPKSLI